MSCFRIIHFLCLILFHFGEAAHFRNEVPVVKIYEIRPSFASKLEVSEGEHLVNKPPNSNIVVGEDIQPESKLILECDARYPVQWIYTGDGMPEYSTNTTQTQSSGGITRPDSLFAASISLGYNRPIGFKDSGRYTCRSLQNPDLSVFYYLYVSDSNKLFVSSEGETIYYRRGDSSVRIPCSVTNPKTAVTLQKSINGLVQCPLNESISYDSTSGYELKLSSYFDPAGTYLCTAGFNNTYQVVRYTLVRDETNDIGPTTPSTSHKGSCTRNTECGASDACIRYSCTSPCASACGRNTQCDVASHVARCHCLPGHTGDPYKACYVHIKPESIEQRDPCTPTPCGLNTICERHNTLARCVCAPGHQGDPYTQCRRSDPCQPNPCGDNGVCQHRSGYTSCSCRPGYYGQPPYCRAECEVDTHCPNDRACVYGRCRNPCEGACVSFRRTECRVINRKAVCATISCPQGYYGRDCLNLYGKSDGQITPPARVGTPIEHVPPTEVISPCVPFPCGREAECVTKSVTNEALNTTSDVALCQCPPEKTGNADVECYPTEEQAVLQSDQPEIELPEPISTNTSSPTIVDIDYRCTPECGINAKCSMSTNNCVCPSKYNGNPYIKCYPTICTTNEDCDNINASCILGRCSEKQCGVNAIAIVAENGKSTCTCPTNFTGIATLACHPIINTPANETSPTPTSSTPVPDRKIPNNGTCVDETVRVKCGPQSICKRFHDLERCVCSEGHFGDPLSSIGCTKGIQCNEDSQCTNQEECVNGKCVNVCRHRNFCGPLSGCKGDNHKATCICHIGAVINPNGECESAKGALAERFFFRSFEDV